MNSMNRFLSMLAFVVFAGCATPSGNYVITAIDATGMPIASGIHMTAAGRGVYTARNAFCAGHPQAVVTIRSQATGKELEGESPYRCR
jgi:hypothetical protein